MSLPEFERDIFMTCITKRKLCWKFTYIMMPKYPTESCVDTAMESLASWIHLFPRLLDQRTKFKYGKFCSETRLWLFIEWFLSHQQYVDNFYCHSKSTNRVGCQEASCAKVEERVLKDVECYEEKFSLVLMNHRILLIDDVSYISFDFTR